jgi:hypothetical protein
VERADANSAGDENGTTSSRRRIEENLSSLLPTDILLVDFDHQCSNLQNQYTRMHGRIQLITGLTRPYYRH